MPAVYVAGPAVRRHLQGHRCYRQEGVKGDIAILGRAPVFCVIFLITIVENVFVKLRSKMRVHAVWLALTRFTSRVSQVEPTAGCHNCMRFS